MENESGKGKKSLYQVAIDDIMGKINRNEFSFEKPICTEKTLMEQYGFSRITAKRAITELEHQGILYRKRGRGSFVSRDIFSGNVQKVSKNAHIFALVLPFDISKGGIFETVQEINNILNASGYYMCIYITENPAKERSVLKQLVEKDISGIVFYPLTNDYHLELLNTFAIKKIPIVVIDKSNDCIYIHSVVSDNYKGGFLLTEHLISQGHHNIAYLTRFGTAELTTIRDRFGGYLYAMEKASLVPKMECIIKQATEYDEPSESAEKLKSVIKSFYESGVTAIEAENDEVAFYVILACKELGISVPDQMSVCGFDNTEWSRMASPNITTVRQNFSAIGQKVSDILLKSVNGESLPAEKAIIPVELIVQSSTGPVRKA